jgi:hypothetical protein
MLRTNSKLVQDRLKEHVLENFEPESYGGGETLQNLKDQLNSMQYAQRSIYQTAIDYVEGGSYLVYYGDVRNFLYKLLEESGEYHKKYSDEQVWRLYCHLIARTMTDLYQSTN